MTVYAIPTAVAFCLRKHNKIASGKAAAINEAMQVVAFDRLGQSTQRTLEHMTGKALVSEIENHAESSGLMLYIEIRD